MSRNERFYMLLCKCEKFTTEILLRRLAEIVSLLLFQKKVADQYEYCGADQRL